MPDESKWTWRDHTVGSLLLVSVAVGAWLALTRPLPGAFGHEVALKLAVVLLCFWFLYRMRPMWVFTPAFRVTAVVAALALAVGQAMDMSPRAEVVRHYLSVFRAMEAGLNPYTCGTIFHIADDTRTALGNFNYPPMEIYPYYLTHLLTGRLDLWLVGITNLIIQALAGLVFLRTFPNIRRRFLLPLVPLFVFGEFRLNPALSLLVTALILFVVTRHRRSPRPTDRFVVAVLFGIGLMTKFIVLPIMAAYYWHHGSPTRPRTLWPVALDVGVALLTALLIMAPYGVRPVLENTILFNVVLSERATLTTFFPNVLSGLFVWFGHGEWYSPVAVAALVVAVLLAPRLGLYSAMLTAVFTFLLVAPTPVAQFLFVVLYVVVAGIYTNLDDRGRIPAEVRVAA